MTPREAYMLIACAGIIGLLVGFFIGLRLGSIWAMEYTFKKLAEKQS